MTKWIRVMFDGGPHVEQLGVVKTHAIQAEFYDEIVGSYLAQSHVLHPGIPGTEFMNPKVVTEWGFDLGGSSIQGRPYEVFDVAGLAFSLPSEEIQKFHSYWQNITPRLTATKRVYVKLKGSGCLVLTPELHTKLVGDMKVRIPAAEARSETFMLEWTQKHSPMQHGRGLAPDFVERLNSKRRGN